MTSRNVLNWAAKLADVVLDGKVVWLDDPGISNFGQLQMPSTLNRLTFNDVDEVRALFSDLMLCA